MKTTTCSVLPEFKTCGKGDSLSSCRAIQNESQRAARAFRPILFGLTAVVLGGSPSLHAADRTWGNTATDYNAGASWTGAAAPGSGDAAVFSSAVTNQPALSANITNQQIRFTTSTGGWTLNGTSALTLTSTGTGTTAGTGSAIVGTNTSGTNTINAAIILGGAAASTATINQTASGTLAITGNISSTNAITGISLTGASGSVFTLAGNNTYSGNTTLSSGSIKLNINSATAIGAGALVFGAAATIDNTSGSAITLANNNNISLANNLTFTGTRDLSFGSGTATLSASRSITVTAGNLTIGSINADTTARVLTKLGSGTLILANAAGANFQGGTTVSAGTLSLGHKDALGTGALGLTGTLSSSTDLSGANAVGNTINLNANSAIAGSNNLTLSGAFTNKGGSRTLTINNAGATELSGPIYLSEASGTGRTLTVATTTNATISGAISNFNGSGTAGGLTNSAAGTLTLTSASSNYTGVTTVTASGGIIAVSKLADGGQNSSIGASSNAASNMMLSNGAILSYIGSGDSTDRLFTINGNNNGHAAKLDASGSGAINFTNIGSLAYGTANQTRTLTLQGSSTANNTFAITIANNGSGATALTKSGTGTWVLTGNNTHTGTTTVSDGVLVLGSANALTGGIGAAGGTGGLTVNGGIVGLGNGDFLRALGAGIGQVSLTTGGFAAYGANRSVNLGGASASVTWGSGSFVTGAGAELSLGTTGADGTLDFQNSIALGNATRTVNVANGSAAIDAILSGVLSASGASGGLTKNGTGTLGLTAANTYTGPTLVNAGTLQIGNGGTTGSLNATSSITNDGTLAFNRTDTTTQGTHFSTAAISGGGSLVQNGTGTLVLNAANTYTGGTALNAGTIQIASSNALGTSGNITFSGGTLQFTADSSGVDYAARIKNSTSAIALDTNGQSVTFAGAIDATNTLGLAKTGAGTLTLNGSNTYTGATTVNAGTLAVNGSIASSSLTTVNSGAVLVGSGTVGALTIASGGTINPGNSPGTLTVGDTTWNGGGNYNWQIYDATGSAGTGWDLISSSGTLTIGATSGDKFKINLWSLSGIAPDANGTPENFNVASNYSWNLASFSSISGFSLDKFQVDTAASNGTGGFSGFTGTFSLSSNGTVITLNYTAPSASAQIVQAGNWSTNATWLSGSAPTNGVPVEISGAGGTSTNNLLTSVNSLTFTANATGSYTVAGNSLETGGSGILNNSAQDQTVSLDIALGASQTFAADSANLTISGDLALSSYTLTAGGNQILAVQGDISGTGGIVRTDGGTLVLSGNNNYSGSTSITSGTLLLTGALSNSSITLSGGLLDQTSTGSIAGADATLTLSGGNATLAGANTYTGTTTITAGTLQIGAGATTGSLSTSSSITNNGVLIFNRSNDIVQGTDFSSSAIGGSGSFVQDGSGNLTLSSANTYSGGTTLNSGTLNLNNASAIGTGMLTINGGTLNNTSGAGITLAGNNAQSWDGDFVFAGTNNLNLGTGAVALGSSSTRTVTVTSGNLTVGGIVSGPSSSLVKNGGGLLSLGGNNTYSGSTTVAAGILQITNNGSLGTTAGNTTVSSGATLALAGGITVTGEALAISGSGDFGAGALRNLSGNNTYANTVTLLTDSTIGSDAGTLTLSSLPSITGNFNVTFVGAGDFNVRQSISIGNRGVTMNGTGRLTIGATGGSSYTGNTTINAGTLAIGATNRLNDSTAIIVNNGATFDMATFTDSVGAIVLNDGNITGTTGSLTGASYSLSSGNITATLAGSGAFTKNGSGTVSLTANSTYTAKTVLNQGTLSFSRGNASATGAQSLGANALIDLGVASTSSATLDYTGTGDTLAKNINILGNGNDTIQNSGSGLLTLSGSITKNGTTLTLAGGSSGITVSGVISGSANNSDLVIDGGTTTLTNENTYNGPTTIINSGTLNANAAGALPTGTLSSITINGDSTLALGANQSIASLNGTSGSNVNLNANTLTINGSASSTYSGGISGSGSLVKDGSGTQSLAGATTFTGTTTVNSGTLTAAAAGALGASSNIDINSGSLLVTVGSSINDSAAINLNSGTLAVNGDFNETVGALTLSANSIIDLNGFSGILRFSGLSWASGASNATLAIWNWSGTPQHGPPVNDYTNPSHVVFTSDANLTSENLAKISFYSGSGIGFVGNAFADSFSQSGFATGTEIIAVPEPETYLTCLILFLGFGIYQFRLARQGRGHFHRFTCLRHGFKRKSVDAQPEV